MALYYVQTERGAPPLLDEGLEFSDLAAARVAVARAAAARLCDRVGGGTAEVSIYVTDGDGRELFAATATVAISPLA